MLERALVMAFVADSRPLRRWLGVIAATGFLLADCSKPEMPTAFTPMATAEHVPNGPSHVYAGLTGDLPNQEVSWMAPGTSTQDLLYVSNVHDVTVYSYPQDQLVGKLKGFYVTGGECVDKAQNVWITDFGHGRLVEYAHGGTKPLRIITGIGGPGCAINLTTGDLAVTTEGASLYVYKNARGKPVIYKDRAITEFWFCGYDGQGNLFADGSDYHHLRPFELAELPKGGTSLRTIRVGQSLSGPGGVQWHGKYLAVGDDGSSPAVIYQFSIRGTYGKVVGSTRLGSNADFVYQFFIKGRTLIAPNNYFTNSKSLSNVLFFDYPKGGKAINKITKGVFYPHGAAVSLASTVRRAAEVGLPSAFGLVPTVYGSATNYGAPAMPGKLPP